MYQYQQQQYDATERQEKARQQQIAKKSKRDKQSSNRR